MRADFGFRPREPGSQKTFNTLADSFTLDTESRQPRPLTFETNYLFKPGTLSPSADKYTDSVRKHPPKNAIPVEIELGRGSHTVRLADTFALDSDAPRSPSSRPVDTYAATSIPNRQDKPVSQPIREVQYQTPAESSGSLLRGTFLDPELWQSEEATRSGQHPATREQELVTIRNTDIERYYRERNSRGQTLADELMEIRQKKALRGTRT